MQFDSLQKIGTEENFLATKIVAISSMTFLGVEYGVIFLLVFFMFSDTILGISKAVVLEGWGHVTKLRFWSGFLTKLTILFIPLSVAVTAALLGYNLSIFVMTTMYVLIANDAISCYTNILSIKKKKNFVNKDLIELLINSLRSLIFNSAKSALDKLKNSDLCPPMEDQEDEKKS